MAQNYIVKISEHKNSDGMGSKGSNLHFLSRNGFNVPQAYFLTFRAYTCFIETTGINKIIYEIMRSDRWNSSAKSRKISEAFMSEVFPEDINPALDSCGLFADTEKEWAVRSSSNLEDLSGSSFAGLYDTYLRVKGRDDLRDAIRKCWASLWSERAITYRKSHNLKDEQIAMAVVIQEMVDSVYSGVIFSMSPGCENSGEMYLEYCRGLGEGLVSGQISPYACRISRDGKVITHLTYPEENRLSDERIREIAGLAVDIEKLFSRPQDIEWAFDGNKVYILQSRPITKINFYKQQPLKEVWTRANVGEVFPNAVTPLTWRIFQATILNRPGLEMSVSENDDSLERAGIRKINGYIYIRLDFFLDSFCYLPCVTPDILHKVLGVNLLSAGKEYKKPAGFKVKAARIFFMLNLLKIWPRLSLMLKKLSSLPAASSQNSPDLIAWNSKCFYMHLKATAYAIGAFAVLEKFLKYCKGKEAEQLLPDILTGREDIQTAAQGLSLAELADKVRGNRILKEIFEKNNSSGAIMKALSETGQGKMFFDMLNGFMSVNGARAAGEFELAVPRWKEDPAFIILLLQKLILNADKGYSAVDYRKKTEERSNSVLRLSSQLPFYKRWMFLRLLASYRDFSTMRENLKYKLIEGYANLRFFYLDIARELVKAGAIAETADIFFLTPAEIKEARTGKNFLALIKTRKFQYAGYMSEKPAAMIGESDIITKDVSAGSLTGIACSPGRVEGVARVLTDISEAGDLKPGEIMVTLHTDPGWTPLFLTCKAVVTEIGGFLSHGATVAREYGIPAVVNVKGATGKISTGDTIVVDGNKGTVVIKQKL